MIGESRAQVMLPRLDELVAALRMPRAPRALPMLCAPAAEAAADHARQGDGELRAPPGARAAHRGGAGARQDERRGGNYNAHVMAYRGSTGSASAGASSSASGSSSTPTPRRSSRRLLAELLDAYARANSVLLDLDRDLWGYISLGYFRQKVKAGEVGSSTMPHKVNRSTSRTPRATSAWRTRCCATSPRSCRCRWQRDLSDSTAQRNVGTALGHTLLACSACLRGLAKLEADPARLAADLDANWEVLAEAVQQVMRRHGVADAYDKLKAVSRGKRLERRQLAAFVRALPLPSEAKKRLLALRRPHVTHSPPSSRSAFEVLASSVGSRIRRLPPKRRKSLRCKPGPASRSRSSSPTWSARQEARRCFSSARALSACAWRRPDPLPAGQLPAALAAQFIRNGILPVILDTPSDQQSAAGMSDTFRAGARTPPTCAR